MTLTKTRLTSAIQFALICACLTLSACATEWLKPSDAITPNSESDPLAQQADKQDQPEFADFNFDQDTMYDLLVAEVAAQRQQFNITLLNYIQQARVTRDPGIIKRAINAAQFTKDMEAIQEMALLWAEVEPESIPAHQLLAFQYSLKKMYADAMKHTDILLQLGGEARAESLAIGSKPLPLEDKTTLLELYQQLYEKYPDNNTIGYSIALVQRNLQNYEEGLGTLAPIIENSPDFQPAVVLKVNLLYDNGEFGEAIEYAEKKYDDFPENHTLGRLYASMLIEDKQLDQAEKVFYELMQLYPQAPGLKLSYALVSLENKNIEVARTELEELLEEGLHTNEANFYLGRIADNEKDYPAAIKYYQQVSQGVQFEPALERSSFLLTQEDKTDEAIARLVTMREQYPEMALKLWILQYKLLSSIKDERAEDALNQAIDAFPQNEQLRYARAMAHEEQDNLEAMESDLRVIIKNNPQHAVAINALGYTLADRTDRLEEAFELIKTALSLKPENPAILDSMGWVLYRLDRKEEAALLLLKAFQTYPDGEVAAHLGEVLWMLEKQQEARTIWEKVLEKNPKHKVLLKTIMRLDPSLLTPSQTETETGTEAVSPESKPATPGGT